MISSRHRLLLFERMDLWRTMQDYKTWHRLMELSEYYYHHYVYELAIESATKNQLTALLQSPKPLQKLRIEHRKSEAKEPRISSNHESWIDVN
jgi:hypothetical protein